MSDLNKEIKVKVVDAKELIEFTNPHLEIGSGVYKHLIECYSNISHMMIDNETSSRICYDFYLPNGLIVYATHNKEEVDNYFEILENQVEQLEWNDVEGMKAYAAEFREEELTLANAGMKDYALKLEELEVQ